MENKRAKAWVAKTFKSVKEKGYFKLAAVHLMMLTFLCASLIVNAAGNPAENIRQIGISWIEPIFYVAIAAFGVYLFVKRKFSELIITAVLAVIAAVLIFNTETFVAFLEGLGVSIIQ
ncbi:hypothetical protein OCV51_07580 [Faecalicatena acetigenes]|uniref:Uncharacterized protein n=1 Tax=Faecalicatena acetigenes TaxID=2981790 RepID=A0ABT2TBY6_9FIRM|nr:MULTISPECIES: hypothetical protein [Lachnospiraceae]MCU6747516.1 hypothetical protein [Faecalicatena acetigenes]SCH93388.1 Uncharacterised protein [uncultured Clostridium sp.]